MSQNKRSQIQDAHEDNQSLLSVASARKTGSIGQGRTSWKSLKEDVSSASYLSKSDQYLENAFAFEDASPETNKTWKNIEQLKQTEFYKQLPEKKQLALIKDQEKKTGRIHALDNLTKKEKGEHGSYEDDDEEYQDNRKVRDKEAAEYRLRYLWMHRKPWQNWLLVILFHVVVLINFTICICESYRLTFEDAKFDRLYLDDDFNCLNAIDAASGANHFICILHALFCVSALFTEKLETAKLCWALVLTQMLHVFWEIVEYLYKKRFPRTETLKPETPPMSWPLTHFAFMIFSTIIYIHRYYDMTHITQKRAQRFTASIYSGRLLNEHIIFKNESNFLQKKYTLRQAQALQIYGIVQKIEHYKQKGRILDQKELDRDVDAAVHALNALKGYNGPNMLRELKKRNAKWWKQLQHSFNPQVSKEQIAAMGE